MPAARPNNDGATKAAEVALDRYRRFTLRRFDDQGAVAADGLYAETGIVTFAAMPMTRLHSFFGAAMVALVPDGTAIEWQVSTDGNDTWLAWTGAAWAAAGATWNAIEVVNENIGTLAVGARSPRLRARLSSNADRDATPLLAAVWLRYELRQQATRDAEDAVYACLSTAQIRLTVVQKLDVAAATMTVGTNFRVTLVERCYNKATGANLLTSAVGGVVTFPAVQAAKTRVESVVLAACDVKIGLADEELEDANLPVFGVILAGNEILRGVQGVRSREGLRQRRPRTVDRFTVNVFAHAAREDESAAMADALYTLLSPQGAWFPHAASGEAARVTQFTPYQDFDSIRDGQSIKRVDFDFLAPRYDESFDTLTQIQQVRLSAGGRSYLVDL